ncbi:hypothetical protein Goshw_017044, partial [Gossypium schwendimanii]|nr:hypothetical protein [Gossypium schwendimanii]
MLSVLQKKDILEKFLLLHQCFGLEQMLLIVFMHFPADWPRLVTGRY